MRISSLDQYVSERVRPFIFLSHPVADSPSVVSEHWSRYYTSGPNDVYLLIGWGAVLVTMRWILLGVFSQFARWWLLSKSSRYASLDEKSRSLGDGVRQANGVATAVAQNGHAAGNGTRSRSRTGSPPDSKDSIISIEASRLRSERQAKKIAKLERLSTRFAEQATTVVYYIIAWLFGLWVTTSMYPDGRGFLDTDAYWTLYPHAPLPGPIKAYYFLAFAFYSTQLVIINLEERRKDHWQMFTHHVLTVGLISWSYYTHLSRPGVAILFLLDWCDIFLPLAKMSKYLRIAVLPDILFVIFLVSWFITRQVLLLKIILSVTFDMPRLLSLEWDPSRNLYITYKSCLFFAISLWLLYALLCAWFWTGCKVAYNVVRGKAAEDTRSDDEESDDPSTPALSRTQSKDN